MILHKKAYTIILDLYKIQFYILNTELTCIVYDQNCNILFVIFDYKLKIAF